MSFASKVLIGLGLGILTGVVFGDLIAFVGIVGRGFVLLLQMAVLPFVSVSLIAGLGGLSAPAARSLVRFAGGFLLLIWGMTLFTVVATPLAFPDWPAASFFSAALVEEREDFDFIAAYIPENPFRALSEGVVPAVVVFSLAFGLALMGSERKTALLDALLAVQDALSRVTSVVVRLAPYGIFAIAAEAAGTTAPEQLAGLQVYVVTYVVLSIVLSFWVLPALVAAVTPLSYREILGPARDALITAFATGSLFIVLPILAERAKTLFAEREEIEEAGRQIDVVVPIAFTLGGAGKLLGLVFVLFAGWQSGFPLSTLDYPQLAGSGLFSSFAGSVVSIPFLLDLFRVPADMFQLFLVVDSVIGNRFSAMTGSMHVFSLSLLVGCGAAGWVTIRPRRFLAWAFASALVVAAALGAIRFGFQTFDRPYEGYREFIERSFLLPTRPWRDLDAPPEALRSGSGDALRRIRDRGTLRVGYTPDRLPYAFRNAGGELVGFDIEMAHALARDLNVRIDFFRGSADRFPALLDSGALDIVMSGLAITPERLEQMSFSTSYLQETLAFVVRDHRRDEFRTRRAVQAIPRLRLAVPSLGYYAAKVRDYLPDAEVTVVESPRVFFRAGEEEFDALVFAAETGAAWTLIYPEFTVAVPHPDVLRVPIGYATARDDRRMAEFTDAWIALKRNDRTIGRLFEYWFEGKEAPGRKRRWSLARNVLGWGSETPGENGKEDTPTQQAPPQELSVESALPALEAKVVEPAIQDAPVPPGTGTTAPGTDGEPLREQ